MDSHNFPAQGVPALIKLEERDRLAEVLDAQPELLHAWSEQSWMAAAASVGALDVARDLLSRGATANDTGADGVSPLEVGVEYPEMVALLLEHGADARRPGIMVAAASRATETVFRQLVAAGGDVHLRSGDPPRSALEQAQSRGRDHLVAVIEELGGPASGFRPEAWLTSCLGPMVPLPFVLQDPPVEVRLIRRRHCTLCITVGLSEHDLAGVDYRAEVLIRLPANYPDTAELGPDVRWPVDWLLSCAELARVHPLLQELHTVGHGEPPQPLGVDTPFVGSIILPADVDAVPPRDVAGRSLRLLELMPVHPAELSLGRQDPLKLMRAFVEAGLPDEPIVRNDRRSVV